MQIQNIFEGKTQRQIAEIVGVNHRTVGRDIAGANAPNKSTPKAKSGTNAPKAKTIAKRPRLNNLEVEPDDDGGIREVTFMLRLSEKEIALALEQL